jgi:protease-4
MGSPFRPPLTEENRLFQHVIASLNARFISLLKKHRKINENAMKKISTAQIFIAQDALKLGLIDKICYLDDALAECRKLADIPSDARVVIFRRKYYPDDNIYNTSMSEYKGTGKALIDLGVLQDMGNMKCGFYCIWPGALTGE